MSYTIQVKNISGSAKAWCGKEFAVDEEYTIPITNLSKWQTNDTFLAAVALDHASIGDGSQYFTSLSEALGWLNGTGTRPVEVVTQKSKPPFASKVIPGTDYKLFKRDTGKAFAVTTGSNDCDFVIPFNIMKVTGVEIMGAELGDHCDFEVYDTPSGAISTVPNYKLNQFGYSVYISKDYYRRECQYDADVIKDMKIRVKFTSVSDKTIYINYIIHEVV